MGETRKGEAVKIGASFARWLDAIRFKVDTLTRFSIPTGVFLPTLATTDSADGEFILVDGRALSKSDYPELHAIIGNTFGSTALSFNIPNLADVSLMGAGGIVALGATAGSATTSLTVDNLPAHSHDVTDPGHTHAASVEGALAASSGSLVAVGEDGTTGNATTGITIQSTGNGQPVSTLSPMFGTNFWLKT